MNHLTIPIELYSLRDDTNIDSCGTLNSESDEPLFVPLHQLYTATGQFYLRPTDDLHETSAESISWHDFEDKSRFTIRCDLTEDSHDGLFIDAVVTTEDVQCENGKDFVDKLYTVHLYPPLHFRNLLPMDLNVTLPVEKTLKVSIRN